MSDDNASVDVPLFGKVNIYDLIGFNNGSNFEIIIFVINIVCACIGLITIAWTVAFFGLLFDAHWAGVAWDKLPVETMGKLWLGLGGLQTVKAAMIRLRATGTPHDTPSPTVPQ